VKPPPDHLDIDFGQFAEMGNLLLPKLAGLQQEAPLAWSAINRCWIATGHEFVVEGFSGRLPLSAQRHRIIASFFPDSDDRERRIGYLLHIFAQFVINMDPPGQLRLRKLLMKAFSREVAESFRPFVRSLVSHVLGAVDGNREIDFIADIARPITARAILHIIGLPDETLPRLEHWAQTINSGLSGNPDLAMIERTNGVLEEMRDLFEAEIKRRDGCDLGDFLSHLMSAREGSDSLTRDEVIAQLILILIAGHDTTMNSLALVVARLADKPAERDYIRVHPDRFDACIMELMRVVAMSTSMMRIVTEDFDWHGQQLRKGQFIFLMIAAANRDPAVFPDPERIDFDRPQHGNMTFAPGRHFCIGHWFAKMMLSEALPALLDRYEEWEVLEDRLAFTGSTGFRGPVRLSMRFHPRIIAEHAA